MDICYESNWNPLNFIHMLWKGTLFQDHSSNQQAMESSEANQTPKTPENNAPPETQPPESQGDATSVEKAEPGPSADFPDGGLQAWTVAISASCVLFCTLGYVNSFGFVILY